MVKIIDAVFVSVTTPELWPARIGMTLPHVSLFDAMQYELEECVRRQSFARRYGFRLEQAIDETSMTAARMAADDAPASAGDAHKTHCDEARG